MFVVGNAAAAALDMFKANFPFKILRMYVNCLPDLIQ